MEPLLSVRNLDVAFDTATGPVRAVRGLSFDVGRGEIVALVGESGSGKSNAVLGVLDLVRAPGRRTCDSILFDGQELVGMPARQMRRIRGGRIGMIFQDPMTALNPLIPVGRQLIDLARDHLGLDRAAARTRALSILARVGITAPEERMKSYPHQMSGGIRQRVMIAMALICEPDLLIADEPTTALDVTIQAQIIELVKELQAEFGLSIIWITHDLGVVATLADRVIVMYGGREIETGSADDVFNRTGHPYTQALLDSMPRIDAPEEAELRALPSGRLTSDDSGGCAFSERCPRVFDRCRVEAPPFATLAPAHQARCWLPVDTLASEDVPGASQ
ncbi:ABC transporter ATP-binding protein [Mesobacterium pallidum]|uniref:ABC transporter ATP-binding protein n=1 Tax=Mesobacterium pallidum TaxID=2872037 RepID=UPI001EE15FE0|nr:ABC transporter ATP-binding protein [Mesobacterium pallidum]